MPEVSIIIPVYNGARYLSSALASIQTQTLDDIEIVVVDDGSTDRTAKICRQAAASDNRIKLLSRPNTGIVGALNDALGLCRSPFIARMDADDLAHSERLVRQVAFLRNNPSIAMAGCSVDFIDERGKRLKTYNPPTDSATIRKQLLDGNSGAIIHPTLMGRADIWRKIGPYRETYKYVEDYDLYLRALEHGGLANLDCILLKYRIHAQSTNYKRRSEQIRLLHELWQNYREANRLPTTGGPLIQPAEHADLSSVYREWSDWALTGGEHRTATKYAFKSLIRDPINKRSLKLFLYALRRCI